MPKSIANKPTRILLDYKNGDLLAAEAAPSPLPDSRRLASVDRAGNGRIRKSLGVVTAFGFAAMAIEASIYTPESTVGRLTTPAVVAALPQVSPTLTAAMTAPAPREPKFVFKKTPLETSPPVQASVPFMMVDDFQNDAATGTNTDREPPMVRPQPSENISAQSPDLLAEPSLLAIKVQKGNTLSGLLSDHGLSVAEIAQLTSLPEVRKHLVNMQPGQEMELELDEERKMTRLARQLDLTRTLQVTRASSGERFQAKLLEQPLKQELAATTLTLDSSLYTDGKRAGLSDALIMDLYSIFQWTVDFNREVRSGDTLHLLHETFYKDGEKVKDGKIVAAEYRSNKNAHTAFRHTVGKQTGYYSDSGQSLTNRFLRNPIKARVTSRFNLQRKHPILHTIRAHRGVDYGAPQGTPISAAGDGRIKFIGVQGGFGNTIVIQHGDRYSTLYAHLSKFADGLKKGSRVSQGDTIGLVGKTGLATGAHLHYEFRVDNVHRDPQKVELPGAPSLRGAELQHFLNTINPLNQKLASMRDSSTSDTLAMR